MDSPPGHRPVLWREVTEILTAHRPNVIVDCTVGLGGHASAILDALVPQEQGVSLLGIDHDEENLRKAKELLGRFGERVRLFHANFADLPDVLAAAGVEAADAIVADLGVASTQIDDPSRGLSFQADGPLDMRMDRSAGATAEELVNELPERELADLIYQLGEERYSRRIAAAIVAARRAGRIDRTLQLTEIVVSAMPAAVRRARRGVHPATRTFQALRLAVNHEMENLDRLLKTLPLALKRGGRAAIISFHSLEDRRVKQAFRGWADVGGAKLLTRKPWTPTEAEVAENPRSRSAKLRAAEKLV